MQLRDLLDQCSLTKDHFSLQDHCELQCLEFLFLQRYLSHVNLVEMLCLSQLEDLHKTYSSNFAFIPALHRVLIFFLIHWISQIYHSFQQKFLSSIPFSLSTCQCQDQNYFPSLPSTLFSIESQVQGGGFTSSHFDSLQPLLPQLSAT